ncbi:hypothetical protein GCM10007857_19950 [Bradyrhizobium iriomotense]|uniref:Uncharacterized protein n=1 Tax=Bradyrhizobium iriomotense TaxID=441950 RepID=A0ABQ6AXB1_9BRAD|nr:hypothetical protein GCM10007857_19950 [Bradyrhizobium iriomotense]
MRACLESEIPPIDIATAFETLAFVEGRKGRPSFGTTFGCASGIATIVANHGIGFEEFERVVKGCELSRDEIQSLGTYLISTRGSGRLSEVIRLYREYIKCDTRFHSFLLQNRDRYTGDYDEVVNYILVPDRGPYNCNIDCVFEVLRRCPHASSLEKRVLEWIDRGVFSDIDRFDMSIALFFYLRKSWDGPSEKIRAHLLSEAIATISSLMRKSQEVNFAKGYIMAYATLQVCDQFPGPNGPIWPELKPLVDKMLDVSVDYMPPDALREGFDQLRWAIDHRTTRPGDRRDREPGSVIRTTLDKAGDIVRQANVG